ncbi:MAG: hypothetical protein JXR48_09125 [Candidatus Delongbacteria bacterium]|nr:hypothetical protein [Candidatus Delongbacteria bacterium]MBN2835113.1 hypothetical protein [Candidatus Delongbacteria bacterium]
MKNEENQNLSYKSIRYLLKEEDREKLISILENDFKRTGLTLTELAKKFIYKNFSKVRNRISDFFRTGVLDTPQYFDILVDILGSDREAINKIFQDRIDSWERNNNLFFDNLSLILKHSETILKNAELYYVTHEIFVMGSAYVGGRNLFIGELLRSWNENVMIDNNCCGRVLIYCNTGSVLSGSNSYTGICENCGKVISFRGLCGFAGRFMYFKGIKTDFDKPEKLLSFEELIERLEKLEG